MKCRLFVLSLLFATSFLHAIDSKIQAAVDRFLKDPALKYANVSICVMDVKTGKELGGHNKNAALVPASAVKAVTTSSAIAMLGKDFRYETRLAYKGTISDKGILQGDIWILGGGDPTLGSTKMKEVSTFQTIMGHWVKAITDAGIKQVTGSIIVDDRYFGADYNHPLSWMWYDLGNYYGAGAYGLNMHDNMYHLVFSMNNKVGSTVRLATIDPYIPGLKVRNYVITGKDSSIVDDVYIYNLPGSYEPQVKGRLPAVTGLYSTEGSIPDPGMFSGQSLEKILARRKVKVDKGTLHWREARRTSGGANVLHTHFSPRIVDICKQTNYKSVNMYAEVLLRTLGKTQWNDDSQKGGVSAIKQYWQQKGVSFEGAFLEDGSGLSTRNGLSAHFFAAYLRGVYMDEAYKDFLYTLSQAGVSGSLQYKFKGTSADQRLWAKSGSMGRVRSYTGFAKSKDGKMRTYAILVNNYTNNGAYIRQKMEQLMKYFCD